MTFSKASREEMILWRDVMMSVDKFTKRIKED
jgi:hypothetical protein